MKHVFIPDTQVRPGDNINHIIAAGKYIKDKQPDKIMVIGDWWDMPSLSSYDKPGSFGWEDKDVSEDFDAGNEAWYYFVSALVSKNYQPQIHFFMGNHEDRIKRARLDPMNRRFKSFLSEKQLLINDKKFYPVKVHPYLKIAMIDGIMYSHYFVNPQSLLTNPIGGTIENKLKALGHSFSMGHQQTKQTGSIYTAMGERRNGLVCGRFYQEDHEYLGPQKNDQSWSGIFMKHEVKKGEYDLMEVSMDYLLKEWL